MMTTQENIAKKEGQAIAVRVYMLLTAVLSLFGIGMLGSGIVATKNIDEEVFGPPYFIGGYLVGIMALFSALICASVVSKADDEINVEKLEVASAIHCHYAWSTFMLMGSFLSLIFACIGRFTSSGNMSPLNEDLSIVIFTGCIFGFLMSVVSMCIVCTYGKYFGLLMTKDPHGNTVLVKTNNATAPMGGVHTTTTMFQSGQVNNAQVNQLQMQNQLLLQQQLDLQRQLNQQQPYGGGFYPQAPPPPVYNARSAYPPPPSYNNLK